MKNAIRQGLDVPVRKYMRPAEAPTETDLYAKFRASPDRTTAMAIFETPGSCARVPPDVRYKLLAYPENLAFNIASFPACDDIFKFFLREILPDFVGIALAQCGMLLKYTSLWIKDKYEYMRPLILKAITQDPRAFDSVKHLILSDIEFVTELTKVSGYVYRNLPANRQNSEPCMKNALRTKMDPVSILELPKEFRKDHVLLNVAAENPRFCIDQPGMAYLHEISKTKGERMNTKTALGIALSLRSSDYKYLKETDKSGEFSFADIITWEALTADGLLLEHMNVNVKSDIDFCNTACKQNGLALEFASESIQNGYGFEGDDDEDEDAVPIETALQQNGDAYKFASMRLKARPIIFQRAMENSRVSLKRGDISIHLVDNMQELDRALSANPLTLWLYPTNYVPQYETFHLALKTDGLLLQRMTSSIAMKYRTEFYDSWLSKIHQLITAAINQNGRAIQYVNSNADYISNAAYVAFVVLAIKQLQSKCTEIRSYYGYSQICANKDVREAALQYDPEMLNRSGNEDLDYTDAISVARACDTSIIGMFMMNRYSSSTAIAISDDVFMGIHRTVIDANPLVFAHYENEFMNQPDMEALTLRAIDGDISNVRYVKSKQMTIAVKDTIKKKCRAFLTQIMKPKGVISSMATVDEFGPQPARTPGDFHQINMVKWTDELSTLLYRTK